MKRPVRDPKSGTYTIKNREFKELFGSREQVWNGTAYKTPGGLTKPQLVMNKNHRIVSAVKFHTAKKERRLEKYGYFAKKGKFGYVKRNGTRKAVKKSAKKSIKGGHEEEVMAIDNGEYKGKDYTNTKGGKKNAKTVKKQFGGKEVEEEEEQKREVEEEQEGGEEVEQKREVEEEQKGGELDEEDQSTKN